MHQVDAIAKHILALERAALDRWGKGDPNGYLEISADDVSYFDPFVGQRLDGIQSLTKWYDAICAARFRSSVTKSSTRGCR